MLVGRHGSAPRRFIAVADDLASGRHVRLLPDWRLNRDGVHAVMPGTCVRPAHVTEFLDILADRERRR
jgi:DNA-binding transcriptional LysR family regulator